MCQRLLFGFAVLVMCATGVLVLIPSLGEQSNLEAMPVGRVSAASAETTAEWSMLAANPQRTSWTPEEVSGKLDPVWYRPIDPYISYKVQIIAANGLLYLSTARGLYALDAETGDLAWIYPTELPLGHSPTFYRYQGGNRLYVGGYDRRIHAIDADSGRGIWTYEAKAGGLGAGFETNPLVVEIDGETVIYAGNRDGYMYALKDNGDEGVDYWPPFETDGPILFSAAFKDNTIYFASNDSHAYALNARTGGLVWKSVKLLGAGFHSFWPLVYQDWVIFAGSNHYRQKGNDPPLGSVLLLTYQELPELYPNHNEDPKFTYIGPEGTEPGDWVEGTLTIDVGTPNVTENGSTKPITEYLEEKPWRRTVFVLNRFTGEELTFDSDDDGKPEYAPFAWVGTHSGNRYPPVIGSDGVLYQPNNYMSDPWIAWGNAVGWKFGTEFISRVGGWAWMVDQPAAFSAGGDLIYWIKLCDDGAGAVDATIPFGEPGRQWLYWINGDLIDTIPGYDTAYHKIGDSACGAVYGTINGIYGRHGVQSAMIPYRGKVYLHRGNAVIALASTTADPIHLPLLDTVSIQDSAPQITTDHLKRALEGEVEKILAAGHLRPGYYVQGIGDATHDRAGRLYDYWHNPSDTLYTLIRALPHLPLALQQQARDYLQQEFADYPPHTITHVGWRDGTAREVFALPPDIEAQRSSFGPQTGCSAEWWCFPQDSFYGLWKYAQTFGGAGEIFDQVRNKLESSPSDDYLADNPHVHNGYIAGYIGFLKLEELAGEPVSADVEAELDRLMELRATNFTKDSPVTVEQTDYDRLFNVSRNFMYLVPELADYLREHVYDRVREAVNEYNRVAPGWFVSKYDATYGEGSLQHLYDYHSLFQAKALILEEDRQELVKYLDVPAFEVGDLFYIQNLIAAIEAPPALEKAARPSSGKQGTQVTYSLSFVAQGNTLTLTDTLPSGLSAPSHYELVGTSVEPSYDSDHHQLTWSDEPLAGQQVTISYVAAIATDLPSFLTNTAELSEEGGVDAFATVTVLANLRAFYLPLILRVY